MDGYGNSQKPAFNMEQKAIVMREEWGEIVVYESFEGLLVKKLNSPTSVFIGGNRVLHWLYYFFTLPFRDIFFNE